MKYEIVELEEKQVEGIQIHTTNEQGKSMKDIGSLWQTFFQEGIYENIPNKVNQKTIGLYTHYEGDYTKPYDFIVGAEVNNKNQKTITIPKGKYAKFTIIGDVQQAVGKAWTDIWNMELNRAYTCDFEEYQNTSQNPNQQEIWIYIALK